MITNKYYVYLVNRQHRYDKLEEIRTIEVRASRETAIERCEELDKKDDCFIYYVQEMEVKE